MNITIVNPSVIPAFLYGGTERVIWYLGKELAKAGHKITYLVAQGSECDFGKIVVFNPQKSINDQIPEDTDIVHFNFPVKEEITKPNITTIHGNSSPGQVFDLNTVFVSQDHAERHNSDQFVYNGLDWNDYGKPSISGPRSHFHFLGNAAWKVKNLLGAIDVCEIANERLVVLGGNRINFKMGFRFTTSSKVKFFGMIGGSKKINQISQSKGLIFPVLWNEPFGLALTESLYLGCPVFGTPYGSLPELITEKFGFLSSSKEELARAIKNHNSFNRKFISDYAAEKFNSSIMTASYLKKYEIILSGRTLNQSAPTYIAEKNNSSFIFE
jgi:glycosyltransferase involved in cell wall biosynthesis